VRSSTTGCPQFFTTFVQTHLDRRVSVSLLSCKSKSITGCVRNLLPSRNPATASGFRSLIRDSRKYIHTQLPHHHHILSKNVTLLPARDRLSSKVSNRGFSQVYSYSTPTPPTQFFASTCGAVAGRTYSYPASRLSRGGGGTAETGFIRK
jgi:hypothetical protein